MARWLGAVGAAAATFALLWVLVPGPTQSNRLGIAALALVGEAISALFLSGALDAAPRTVFEAAMALATIIISVGVYFTHARGTGIPFLYMWCTPYAYWFFPRRRALAHTALVVVGFTAASIAASLAAPQLAGRVSSIWGPVLMLTGTVLVTGELVRRLGQTIAASNERFAWAFARAPTPMARVDVDGNYTDVNDAFCSAVGWPRDEIIGASVRKLAPPEQLPILRRHRDKLFDGASSVEQYERDYVRPDGSRVTLLTTNSLLGSPSDPDTELFIQGLDLTERKRAEEALAASERRYRTLVETAQAIVWELDGKGRFTYVNEAVRPVLGYEPEELLGQSWLIVRPDDASPDFVARFADLGPSGSQTGETLLKRKDGTLIIGSYSVAALSDERGRTTGFAGTVLDVTERRRAEEALRVSEARLRALIDNAPAVILIRDPAGCLTGLNREAARVLGGERDALLGQSYEDVFAPEEAQELRRTDERVLAGGMPALSEVALTLDGDERFFLAASFPLPASPGEAASVCWIAFDVTDRERARLALERSNEERRRLLAELVRAQEDERRRIAADVHDESIQVLAGVAIRLGLLSGMLDRPEQERLIAGLDESVRRGIKSLRRLLFDLRLPALDELGLAAAIRSYLSETIAPEGTSYTLDERLEIEPPAELRTVLYRVAQEALSNVRKHAQARHVEVRLDGSGEGFVVTVRDDGIGFDAEDRDDQPGHLGMVGMRERLETAGGWITVHSQPGDGTTVEFGVPSPSGTLVSPAATAGR